MVRPLRLEFSGALYHVTSRGNERKRIFFVEEDRELFLGLLSNVVEKFKWICHAYCLMDNHYHLLIETPEPNLSEGMRQLNGVYTQKINRKRKRVGHLLQGRFKAVLIEKESHLLETARYIVLNPIRAKMVKTLSSWRWSSYNQTAGHRKRMPFLTTDWLLGQFSLKRGEAQRGYMDFVRDPMGSQTIWKGMKAKSVLGGPAFVSRIKGMLEDDRELEVIPRFQRHIDRPGLEELAEDYCVSDKEGRNRFIMIAVDENGHSQSSVARFLGISQSTVSKILKGEKH